MAGNPDQSGANRVWLDLPACVPPLIGEQSHQVRKGANATSLTAEAAIEALDAALELILAGDPDAALLRAAPVALCPAQDVTVLHKLGVLLSQCGRFAEARARFEDVLRLQPGFHFTEHELGDLALAQGLADEALLWFACAVRSQPDWLLGYVRAADILLAANERFLGMEMLLTADMHCVLPRDVAISLVDLLIWHDRRPDAARVLTVLVESGAAEATDQVSLLMILSEIGDYDAILRLAAAPAEGSSAHLTFHMSLAKGHAILAKKFDQASVIQTAAAREAGDGWRSTPQVLGELVQAIAGCQPFSLIRLGDGEGRFTAYCDDRLRGLMPERERLTMINLIWSNWFGEAIADTPPERLASLHAQLTMAVQTADIVGVPGADRLKHDGRHFGYLCHADGFVAEHARGSMADAFVSIRLHELSAHYRGVLGGLDFLGVVGPHAELARRLQNHLGIGQVVSHLVPGEAALSSGKAGRHFQEIYDRLERELLVPKQGAVFLVAAGLLGKVYCSWIKRRGGIAIDIGSVADAWMGHRTRPGQFEAEGWAIPQ